MTIFNECVCVCVCLQWHLQHKVPESHPAIWSLEYNHSAPVDGHIHRTLPVLDHGFACGVLNTAAAYTWVVCVIFLSFCSDAMHALKAEVSRLQETLKSCLRKTESPTSARASPPAQEDYTLIRTSTPRARSVCACEVWLCSCAEQSDTKWQQRWIICCFELFSLFPLFRSVDRRRDVSRERQEVDESTVKPTVRSRPASAPRKKPQPVVCKWRTRCLNSWCIESISQWILIM